MRVLWACLLAIPLFAADVAVAPQSLSFAYQLRSTLTAPNQGLVLASTQPFAYSVNRPTGDGWLIVGNGSNPASVSGTGPGFLPIGVDTRAVGAGTYTSTLSVKVGAGTVPVPVKLFVSAAPILWTDQSLIGFDPGFTLATVGLGMTNGGVVVTSSRKTAPWLTVVDRLGSLTIAGNLEGVTALAAGSVEVTGFPPPANNPVTIPVVLLPLGLNGTPAPLAPSPAALTFTGSGSQQVTVAGPVFSALPDARWVTVFQNG